MKKAITFFAFVFFLNASQAQMEVGYNTTDVGGEFLTYKNGSAVGLHLAANSKLHNSFHAFFGYYIAKGNTPGYYYNNTKGGLAVAVGYRYYTDLRPHNFFIGIKANLFTNKIMLNTQTPEGPYTSKIFIPSLETGYMFLINDMFFITPTVAAGYQTNLESKLSADEKKMVALLGISLGAKF